MQKVSEVKRRLNIGEYFYVKCFTCKVTSAEVIVVPLIDHEHSDKENGQPHKHYHVDFRFMGQSGKKIYDNDIYYYYNQIHRIDHELIENYQDHSKIEYMILPVVNLEHQFTTPPELIKNSKLKHKCIHKGKCPHRGYDLSQETGINGIITCPLHGLKFEQKTGKMIW